MVQRSRRTGALCNAAKVMCVGSDPTTAATFPKLYDALSDWWPVALAAVEKAGNEAIDEPLLERWSRFNELARAYWLSSDEWQRVIQAVEEDERLHSQVGHEIGSFLFNGKKLGFDDISEFFITEAQVRQLDAKEETADQRFHKAYTRLDQYLASTALQYDIYVPLIGLECESHEINLDNDTTIARLQDEDWGRFRIAMSMNGAQLGADRIDEENLPEFYRFGLRIRRTLPELVGPTTFDSEQARAFYAEIDGVITDTIRSLAAATFTQIISWPAQISEQGLSASNTRGVTLRQPQMILPLSSAGAKLQTYAEATLKLAWQHLRHAHFSDHKTNRSIGVALERLGGLGDNIHRPQEQLVDTVIACEAFYMLGEDGTQELRYRVSTNAAFFSTRLNVALAPPAVFNIVYEAYDVRSRVVHGSEVRFQDVFFKGAPESFPSDVDGRLRYFVFYIAELVRQGIVNLMQAAPPGAKVDVNWETIIYGG